MRPASPKGGGGADEEEMASQMRPRCALVARAGAMGGQRGRIPDAGATVLLLRIDTRGGRGAGAWGRRSQSRTHSPLS